MKKHFTNLRIALVGFLVCLMSMSMMAQNVTLDFSVNDWGLATSSAEGGTAAQSFTNTDGYSTAFFTLLRLIPFLPPIAASIMLSRVVGMLVKGMPRW